MADRPNPYDLEAVHRAVTSRSVLRREAVMRGEPAPRFDAEPSYTRSQIAARLTEQAKRDADVVADTVQRQNERRGLNPMYGVHEAWVRVLLDALDGAEEG